MARKDWVDWANQKAMLRDLLVVISDCQRCAAQEYACCNKTCREFTKWQLQEIVERANQSNYESIYLEGDSND